MKFRPHGQNKAHVDMMILTQKAVQLETENIKSLDV